MTDDFRTYEAQRIRLLMLVELAAQASGSFTLIMLRHAMQVRGYHKTLDYLLNQVRWLETEALAVKVLAAGTDHIVTLRSAGRHHVEKVKLLAGVDKPDDEA